MPGMTGLELQERLVERDGCPPIVFMSGSSDIPEAVTAIKNGAEDFLRKPLEIEDLRIMVRKAISISQKNLERTRIWRERRRLFSTLTSREQEVIVLTSQNLAITEIAERMKVKDVTVKKHKRAALDKLKLENESAITIYEFMRLVEPK